MIGYTAVAKHASPKSSKILHYKAKYQISARIIFTLGMFYCKFINKTLEKKRFKTNI